MISFRVVGPIAVAAALLIGCSSVPDPPDRIVEAQQRAAQLAGYGNNYFARGQYTQALRFFELSLRENLAVDHLPGVARSHNSIGRVYLAMADFDSARFHFDTAFAIARNESSRALLVQSYTNLGELALRESDFQAARESFNSGIEQLERNDRSLEAAILYHNLAGLEQRLNNGDDARRLTAQALAINRSARRFEEMAANFYQLAAIESHAGNQQQALEYALLALRNDKRMENSTGIALDLVAIGQIYSRMDDHRSAHDYFRRAYHVYSALRLDSPAVRVLEQLEATASILNDQERAQYYRARREAYEPR